MAVASVLFRVPGEARAWARAGHRGKQHYTKPKDRAYRARVTEAAQAAMAGRAPFEAPVAMSITILRAPPASVSKARRAAMLDGMIRPGVRPDASNVAKGIEDALNGVCYRDDALVVDLSVAKFYAETPGVDVAIGLAGWDGE